MITSTYCYCDNYIILLSICVRHTMKKITILLFLSLLTIEVNGTKNKSVKFVHPGLLHTKADLQRMKSLVAAERQPWYAAFHSFAADDHSSLSYSMQGPDAVVTRDGNPSKTNAGNGHLAQDSVAALQLALMYSITSDDSYAALATRILEEWTNTLIIINGMPIFINILVGFSRMNH